MEKEPGPVYPAENHAKFVDELDTRIKQGDIDFAQAAAEAVENTPQHEVPGLLAELAVRRLNEDEQARREAIIAANKARFNELVRASHRRNPLGLARFAVLLKSRAGRELPRGR